MTLNLPPYTNGATICQGGTGNLIAVSECPSPIISLTRSPLLSENSTATGSIAWTAPENILVSDSPYAVATVPNGGTVATHYLAATNFGFDIPAGAVIKGLTVTVNRSSSGSVSPYIRDNSVKIIRGGTVTESIDRAKTTTDWPSTLSTTTYGGAGDTWGLTGLSLTDVNSPDFGVALSAKNPFVATPYPSYTTATSNENTATTTHHVTLPSGVAANDLLIVFWADNQSPATLTAPDGWTQLYNDAHFEWINGVTFSNRIAWYKIASGGETELTVTTSAASVSAHNAYRIAAGTYIGTPVAPNESTGNNTSPNPPTNNSGFGGANTLWIVASHSYGAATVTPPGGYSGLIRGYTGGTGYGNATMATATLQNAATSENPDNFALSTSGQWAANTIAIRAASPKVATVDYISMTVTYQLNGVLNWYTEASGGTFMGTGSPFNPVGKPGGPVDNKATGIYTFYAECLNVPNCRTATTFEIVQGPDAPVAGSNTYIYDGTAKTMSASVVQPDVVVEWYAESNGGTAIAAPQRTLVGSTTAYAGAWNTVTGCRSLNRTQVTLTINPRPITITVNPGQTKVYGQDDPVFTYTYTPGGLGTGDQFSGALDRVIGQNVGSYAIGKGTLLITDASLVNMESNYTITFNVDNFAITPAPLTITADDVTKVYGEFVTFSGLGFTTVGLQYTDGIASATISSTGAATTAAVGDYDINISAAVGSGSTDLTNYNITYVKGTLTVTAKDLTIAAVDKSKEYGSTYIFDETAPSPDFTVTGITNADAVTNVTMTSAGELATASVAASPYQITPSGAVGSGLTNYNISYLPAELTVTKKALTITAAGIDKIYDGNTTATVTLGDDRVPGDVLTPWNTLTLHRG